MTTRYASPVETIAQIQAWITAGDDVVLNAGSVYPMVVDRAANNGYGIQLQPGRLLDLNGATLLWAGIVNQSVYTQATAMVGVLNTVGGTVRNGTIMAPDSRIVPGGLADASNMLMSFNANGVTMAQLVEDVVLKNGPNQAAQCNNVNGITFRRVTTPAPTALSPATGVNLGHYLDFDVTAQTRLTQAVVIEDCDLDAYGQESIKLENVTNVRFRNTRFRAYVTLSQDTAPYSSMSDVEFDNRCRFDSYIGLRNLRRQWNGSAYDNLGAGTVVIRGRFVGDDALILGGINSVGDTDANQYSALTAELCSFEGKNSHFVPVSGSAWITRSSGVKKKATIYVRQTTNPKYPFGAPSCTVAGAVGTVTTVAGVVSSALTAGQISAYFLATRGVTVSMAAGTWTGSENRSSSWAVNQNVPIDWVGEGGSAGTIIDVQSVVTTGLAVDGSNNAKQRFIGFTLKNAGTRGWSVNNAAADVEMYDVVSQDCTVASGGGGGGRAQNYANLYLGPGVLALRCTAPTSNGGGFQIDAVGTAPSVLEGTRAVSCTGTSGGGYRISSPYCTVKAAEAVNCTATAGVGGMAVSWSVAAITQTITNFSGRGNTGTVGNDVNVFLGTAGGNLTLTDSILGSGGTGLTKTGGGTISYGRMNIGGGAALPTPSGTVIDLGSNQSSDPLFVADTTSVVLQSTSPCKAVATPSWTVGTNRPTLAHDGSWFQVNASSKTTLGARP